LIPAAPSHQQTTRERRRRNFQVYLSQLVIDQVSAGDPAAARDRMNTLKDLPLLDITPDVMEFSLPHRGFRQNPSRGRSGRRAHRYCGVHGMDFLVTWNCVDIANATNARALARVCRDHGFDCPVICTPEELMGE
jgi:hypothetical protein